MGEIVELRFDGPFGPTTGGHLSKKVLANATITVAEAKLIPGRSRLASGLALRAENRTTQLP